MPPGSEMTITTTFSPDRDEIRFIDQQLLQHNQDKIEGYAYEDVLVKSIDRDGNTAAGLHGRIGGGWLYVAGLWVDERCRNQGLGKALMARAEEIAGQRGCTGIYLFSYSFQNPGFYEKLGFSVFGRLDDFCGSHAKIYMRKYL